MQGETIPQGQYVAPIHAAESWVGSHYAIFDQDGDGPFSAHPGDYWAGRDDMPIGEVVKLNHPFRTVTGRTVYGPRTITTHGTIGTLRRLARAAVGRVRP